jgi:predicted unusual protein kinase regulating ubiquinone biosynthesis (AarF/ABC1/UbiB family)
VKVQYPVARRVARDDLRIARWLLGWGSARAAAAAPTSLFREFGDGLREELDFEREARVAAEIAANLAGDHRCSCPR